MIGRVPRSGASPGRGHGPAVGEGREGACLLSCAEMQQAFERSFDSLEGIFIFTRRFYAREEIDPAHHHAVDLAVEELFTNMVKYNAGSSSRIILFMERRDGELKITLTDPDADRFDVTAADSPPVDRPLEEREPGRLGLFLVRKLMDRIDYAYDGRQSRITLTRKLG